MRLFFDDAERLRERAAKPIRARMARDRERSPAFLHSALEYLTRHLFDPNLDITRLRQAVGLKSSSFSSRFRRALGVPPFRYLEACRLNTARNLLRTTGLTVDEVSELVGYGSRSSFAKAFTRTFAMAPGAFRTDSQAHSEPDEDSGPITIDALRRVLLGKAPGEEIETVMAKVVRVYDRHRDPATKIELPFDQAREERLQAKALWAAVEALPNDLQPQVVSTSVYRTTAFFERLRHESRIAGRRNPTRGRAFAELAAPASGARPDVVPDDPKAAGLQARAWSWIAIVRRQNDDFSGAERAIQHAESLRANANDVALIHGEVLHAHADLKIGLWQFRRAEALQTEAIRHLRNARVPKQLITSLLLLGNIHYFRGHPEKTVPLLSEANSLLGNQPAEPRLQLFILQNLGGAFVSLGRADDAASILDRATRLAQDLDARQNQAAIQWQRGLLAFTQGASKSAIQGLTSAATLFHQCGLQASRCWVSIDLAIIYSQYGNLDEALGLLQETIPILRDLRIEREVLVAAEVLHSAVARNSLPSLVLEEVRAQITAARYRSALSTPPIGQPIDP